MKPGSRGSWRRSAVSGALAWELQLISGGFAAAAAAFVFLIWLGRRIYPNVLSFCVIGFGLVWAWTFPWSAWTRQTPAAAGWVEWYMFDCMVWQLASAHFYWSFLHGQRRSWIERGMHTQASRLREPNFWRDSRLDRVMVVLCGLLPLATLPGAPWQLPPTMALAAIACIALVVGIVETRNAMRATSWDGHVFAVAYWLTLLFALKDATHAAAGAGAMEAWLLPYSPLVLASAVGISLARNLVSSRNHSEETTASLERQLRSREAELVESYAKLREVERLQTLSAERHRLTQDMHDGLGSSLVSALRVVESGRMSDARLGEVLKSCIDDLKLTIDSMEPVEADLLLLLATLRFRLGPRLESAGIALRWEVSDVPKLDWLDPRNSLHILRILQEAFANILKHTRASEIRVSTGSENGWVTVTIADNGTGFDLERARQGGGKGLANQQRRAEAIGGEIVLASSAGGTRLTMRLPETRSTTSAPSG